MTNKIVSRGRRFALAAVCLATLLVAGCGGGGSEIGGEFGAFVPTSLNQAGYNGAGQYLFGFNSISSVPIAGAPDDTDFSRWAVLHDDATYRLYFFRRGEMSLYQFGFNPSTSTYEYGYDSIPEVAITGMPDAADPSSIAMLHDGADYRLFMRGNDPTRLYQFAFDGRAYAYGYHSIAVIPTTDAPPDADFSRWAMLYDGTVYRQFVGQVGTRDAIYQFGFNGASYDFGHRSIARLAIVGMPASSDTASFAMLHDGSDYRLYHLAD